MRRKKQWRTVELFRQADRILKRTIDKKVEKTGVFRSQHQLLMILGKHPDCSQRGLAERMEISSAAVAVSLKKLEKAGCISRQMNKNDNRVNRVIITEKGKKIIDVSVESFQEVQDSFFQDFSEEEIDQFAQFLERLIQNGENCYRKLMEEERA